MGPDHNRRPLGPLQESENLASVSQGDKIGWFITTLGLMNLYYQFLGEHSVND